MSIPNFTFTRSDEELRPHQYLGTPFWRIAQRLVKEKLVQSNGLMDQSVPGLITASLINPTLERAAEQVKREQGHLQLLEELHAKLLESQRWVPLLAQFIACGEHVFNVEGHIAYTSAMDDAAFRSLRTQSLPHHCIYVRMGKQRQARNLIGPGLDVYPDGAFVARTPCAVDGHGNPVEYALLVGLTTIMSDGSGSHVSSYVFDFFEDELNAGWFPATLSSIQRRVDGFSEGPDAVAELEELREFDAEESGRMMQAVFPTLCKAFYMVTR